MNEKIEQSNKFKSEVINDPSAVTMTCPKCNKGKITRTGNERANGIIKDCPNCGFEIPSESGNE